MGEPLRRTNRTCGAPRASSRRAIRSITCFASLASGSASIPLAAGFARTNENQDILLAVSFFGKANLTPCIAHKVREAHQRCASERDSSGTSRNRIAGAADGADSPTQATAGSAAARPNTANNFQSMPNQTRSMPNCISSKPNQTQSMPNWIQSMPNCISGMPDCISSMPNCISSMPDCISSMPDCIQSMPNCIQSMPNCISGMPNCIKSMPNCILGTPNCILY